MENCSTYQRFKNVNGVETFVFEEHNLALPVWGYFSHSLRQPLSLVSFDHHTDTHRPSHEALRIAANLRSNGLCDSNGEYAFEYIWKLSCCSVRNDEHILTGVSLGVISGYCIICDFDYDECNSYMEQDALYSWPCISYISREMLLSGQTVIPNIKPPFVLDFDLDFFHESSDFSDALIEVVSPLVGSASCITVAREHRFFDMEKSDQEYSNDHALQDLKQLILCG